MNPKKILVPVDFSEFSDYAVDHALLLAEKYRADVTLFHVMVMHEGSFEEVGQIDEYEKIVKAKERYRFRLLQSHTENKEVKDLSINSKLVRGFSAADVILDYVGSNDIDMVVMGTHGRSGFKKWIYGSVAEKIVRQSPVPVMSVHNPLRKFAFEKILVPVDFSTFSRRAVSQAKDMAAVFRSKLTFLHVVEAQMHPAFYAGHIDTLFAINPGFKGKATESLREFVGDHPDVSLMVTEGQAYNEILQQADAQGVDLILMSTRGLSGLAHFLVGSTTERVVRMSPIPVLTVGRQNIED